MAPPEVNPQIKARGKDVHWYKADIGDVSEPARQLLEHYSRIPPDQVASHIAEVVSLTVLINLWMPTVLHAKQGRWKLTFATREIALGTYFLIPAYDFS